MLTLEYCDAQNRVSERELAALMQENAPLLQSVKQGEAAYTDSLGWLNPSQWAGEGSLTDIERLAARVRADADAFVIIGVGGSNNAARSVIKALQTEGGPEIIYMGNTLSPAALNKALKKLENKNFYINCIAKNFETLEPGISFRLLRALLYQKHGKNAASHILATGTPGSTLEELCTENGYTFVAFPTDIGGRFTAISAVGLLPMAVAGVDIRAVVRGASRLHERLLSKPAAENLALRYACLRNLLYQKGFKMEALVCFEPQYRWFFKWWVQLFAESEGKNGKGLFPVAFEYSEELHSVGQYLQDGEALMFETFLDVREADTPCRVEPSGLQDGFDYLNGKDLWDINKAAFNATRIAHSQKLPCLTLGLGRTDAEQFGELFYFFQFSCYLSGRILGVNPFSQPGVENYKQEMFRALGK